MVILNKLDGVFYYNFFNGTLYNAYDYFGAHIKKADDLIVGCEFLVYVPNVLKVELNSEHNNYKPIEMKEVKPDFYYLFLEGDLSINRYKYIIYTKSKDILYKADPYAFFSDKRPLNDSKVFDLNNNKINYIREAHLNKPMLIYEMHLGSWKKDKEFYNYKELCNELINHLLYNNFTHVEFLPIYEHPLDDSWGYMGTGYYSVTSRYGTPSDLMYLIEQLHKNNIKVILDWVPSHVCKDDFGLSLFNGDYLYEYKNDEYRENIGWGTVNLDLSKGIVQSFLISNAIFWLEYYNIDGFRVDAVSTIIYYLGNQSNGINIEAINFLKQLSTAIHNYDSNTLLIAEDSTIYPDVTKSVSNKGIGFDYKWNMGWMNDTLKYFQSSPSMRLENHNLLTFGLTYSFKENYILAISHDEVVHLKKSLLNKMYGTYEEKFSNLRLYYTFMMTHPGKKLLFMGQEFAHYDEWNFKKGLDFHLFEYDTHNKLNIFFKDITSLYINEPILYETDLKESGFKFIDADNNEQSIYIYSRILNDEHIIVVLNCSNKNYYNYELGVFNNGTYKEIINSDNIMYGGSNIINRLCVSKFNRIHNENNSITINIAKYSACIFKYIK